MSKVVVSEGNTSSQAIRGVIEGLGLAFVDVVKGAKSICIVSTASQEATQTVIDAILFHSRVPIHVLGPSDEQNIVEASIPRELPLLNKEGVRGEVENLRMPIRRPRAVIDADTVIVIAPMLVDRARRTMFSIEQYIFATWYAPERRTAQGMVRSHEPWLEGELRDVVLADLYAQKPIALSIIDGAAISGIALASFDAIAADAVCIHMNGVIPEDVGYLRMLAQQGLGVCTLSKIDVPLGMISR